MYAGLPLVVLTIIAAILSLLAKREKVLIFWLLFSGVVHILLEGSYGIHNDEVTMDNISKVSFTEKLMEDVPLESAWNTHFYAHLYTQYAQYDTRYAVSDPLVIFFCWTELVEGILCFVLIYAVLAQSTWRHPLQILCSTAQFYGTILYFLSPVIYGTWDKVMTKNQFDLWVYVIILNGIWMVAPGILIIQSFLNICPRMRATVTSNKNKKYQ